MKGWPGPQEAAPHQRSHTHRRRLPFREATQDWAQLLTDPLASSQASIRLGKMAAPPNFTSTTRADRLSTTFFLRGEAGGGGGGWGQRAAWRFLEAFHLRAACQEESGTLNTERQVPCDGDPRAGPLCISQVSLLRWWSDILWWGDTDPGAGEGPAVPW
ncbi:hypothetical protein HJG60_010014 [Phyllostomus discolor]|uniref:Uncharacterized protein n=1 Tax=Phyllostomus discolor TaxID=89673 RepID=A0A834ARU2_9CHIR|nr:hypothetical protein HJG60_010014 [Phyllostomus discolor]